MDLETQPLEGEELEGIDTSVEGEPEGEEQATPVTVDDLAAERGWTPKEDWVASGKAADDWRDAKSFLEFGLDRSKDVSRDLKDLRKTTDSMAQTQARIMREQVEKARQDERQKWEGVHERAVEDGDTETARQAVQEIARASQPVQDTGLDQFVADNPWFNTDPQARALATATAETMKHLSPADQFKAAQEAVHKRFPEYAPEQPKAPAKTVEVGAPAATARPAKRGKTFHDLPREAQEAARAMVSQGLLKNTDGYVKQYFNKEGTVE